MLPSDRPGRTWSLAALVAVAFVAALAMGLSVLYRGHPHEDAYILFKYANELASGRGIVYWPGGPHAEGATDFLWMLLLAGARRVGCDVAVAAVLANAAGAAILVGVCAREWSAWTATNALQRLLALVFLVSGPALAAYVGFSALLYAGLAALTFRRTLAARLGEGSTLAIPWLAIVLALFRPDGVVLGVGFTLLAWTSARRVGEARRFTVAAAGAGAIGVAYALWRRAYFGLALPLPLYVKSRTVAGGIEATLPGLGSNVAWSTAWDGALPLMIGIALLIVLARLRRAQLLAFGACLLPAVAHFAALAFARQTQNAGARFQGPDLAILFVSLFFWAARAGALDVPRVRRALASVVGVAVLVPIVTGGITLLGRMRLLRSYAESFGVELGHVLRPDDVLALTEAGRLSYWTDARVEDIVGLNSPATALHPPTVAYLRGLHPDVLVFYAGPFALVLHIADKQPVVEIPPEMLTASVQPEFGDAFRSDQADAFERFTPEQRASLVMARFAVESRAYDLYAVEVLGNYAHVLGVRKGFARRAELLEALEAAASGRTSVTYAQAAGLPWAR